MVKNKQSGDKQRYILPCVIYIGIYGIVQVIFAMYASWNQCGANYSQLLAPQLLLVIAGLIWTIVKEGNPRLVLYAGCLLSIGQLIQSILQTGEDFTDYAGGYDKYFFVVLIGLAVLYFLYQKFFSLMYTPWMQVLVCLALAACFVILIFWGDEQYGAKLWIKVGSFGFQITELFKPLFVFAMAGFLCRVRKLAPEVLMGSLFFTAVISVVCVVAFNEFGTAIILLLTGVAMIFIFQDTKGSVAVAILMVCGVVSMVLVFFVGNHLCDSITKEVPTRIFAEQFGACGNRLTLKTMVQNELEKMSKEDADKNEALMGCTYNEIMEFMDDVSDNLVNNSYQVAGFEEATAELCNKLYGKFEESEIKLMIQYVDYVEALVKDDEFRDLYIDKFLNSNIYVNRMLAAYDAYKPQEEHNSLFEKVERTFLNKYLPLAKKVYNKFSGFFNPEEEGQNNAYQINQGLAAMSTAGLFGNGPKITKNYIFAADSDMVFAMVVSELGIWMGVAVIVLNLLVFQEMFLVGLHTPHLYQQGICIGSAICWIIQTLFIIGGNCRIFPFSGITLPLISNGGSSFVVSILMIFVVLLISVRPIGPKNKGTKRSRRFWKKIEKGLKPFVVIPKSEDEEDDKEEEELKTKTIEVEVEKKETQSVDWKPSEKQNFTKKASEKMRFTSEEVKVKPKKSDYNDPFAGM